MKKLLIIFCMFIFCFCFVQKAEASVIQPDSKILVAYFSMAGEQYAVGEISKGNTAIIAEMIAKSVNANLYQIKPAKSYPTSYLELTKVAKMEKNKNSRPQISGKVPNFDSYDVVFIGFPIWHGDMPMPVYTFLESNDFSKKTIIPFCTHEGNGIAGIAPWIRAATHAKYVHRGFDIRGYIAQYDQPEAKSEVAKWIKALK